MIFSKRCIVMFFCGAVVSANALRVGPAPEFYDSPAYVFIDKSNNDNELIVFDGGVFSASGLVTQDYDSIVNVTGMGSLVNVSGLYIASSETIGGSSAVGCVFTVENSGVVQGSRMSITGRANHLEVKNAGKIYSSSLGIYGGQTEGIVYENLKTYATISGAGSLLYVTNQLSLHSPDSSGAPGLPFDYPREIPAYMQISGGSEVNVGSLSITNGSLLSIGAGGTLTIRSEFQIMDPDNFRLASGSTLNVDGIVGGLNLLNVVSGDVVMGETGMLDLYFETENDGLTVSGDIWLNGSLNIELSENFALTNRASYHLFDWQVVEGTHFDDIYVNGSNITDIISGDLLWDVDRFSATGTLEVIPEPETLALVGLFGIGFLFIRRIKI